jgi:uncharacterized protein YlxP (DUF503 family)
VFVGVAEISVFIPHAGSLKAKRSVVNSLKGRIRSRFPVAVSEVGEPDVWQRAELAVALCGNDAGRVEETLRAVARLAEGTRDGRIVDVRVEVVPWPLGERV